ncbi:hypothetical protein T492DRAFT_841920 [Pavlovales sp. CCMP2436]|nr:hypothetical protein T492DRAFT_841920 [Pavlovales sp. CCMP2436]
MSASLATEFIPSEPTVPAPQQGMSSSLTSECIPSEPTLPAPQQEMCSSLASEFIPSEPTLLAGGESLRPDGMSDALSLAGTLSHAAELRIEIPPEARPARCGESSEGAVVATQAGGDGESSCFISASKELGSRLHCDICKHAYLLPYELTTPAAWVFWRAVLCRIFLATLVWGGIGSGLAYVASNSMALLPGSALYGVTLVFVCLYAIITIIVYIYALGRYEKDEEMRKRKMRPRVKFTCTEITSFSAELLGASDVGAVGTVGRRDRVTCNYNAELLTMSDAANNRIYRGRPRRRHSQRDPPTHNPPPFNTQIAYLVT